MNTINTFNPNLTTNVIQNVINIGGSTACSSGPVYCAEGYSLYFPCLKDITRGQNVCFDFYVADNDTKDVVDLRDIDAISLTLNGQFGCTYGTYSYPDNISSLQTEVYDVVYSDDFDDVNLYSLNLIRLDIDDSDLEETTNLIEKYYYGTEVEVAAYDTPDYVFIGWANSTADDEDFCPDDFIISTEHRYKIVLTNHKVLFAIYRPRTSEDGEFEGEFNNVDIEILTEPVKDAVYEYMGNEYTSYVEGVVLRYIDGFGHLEFNNGKLIMSSMDITDGIKVNLYAYAETPCKVTVTINGLEASQYVTDKNIYGFYISKCEGSDIEIKTEGECLIDRLEICEEKIIDKGKASLCLDSSITSTLPTGPLSVSGAIMVNGNAFGLANTPIGNVNRLNKITII